MQLKIKLNDIRPPVWRRVLVEGAITFNKLHEIIQRVMGWENCHLYKFELENIEISIPDPDDDYSVKDSRRAKLAQFLSEKQKVLYTYDFGDNWEHIITVEKIVKKDASQLYPACIAGKRACPPEDCGGVWDYAELMKLRKNKNHPEYEEKIMDWLGEDYDPEQFNIAEVNRELAKVK